MNFQDLVNSMLLSEECQTCARGQQTSNGLERRGLCGLWGLDTAKGTARQQLVKHVQYMHQMNPRGSLREISSA